MIYDTDLAHIHDTGFSASADQFAAALRQILSEAGIARGLVVELGCGSGVTARRLMEYGYDLVGMDISPAMIELARQRIPEAQFQVGSLWDFPIPTCRCVVALNEVLCYRADEDDAPPLSPLFEKIFAALEPGGLFLFDVAEVGLGRDEGTKFHETPDWCCGVRFEYDTRRDRLTRHITTFRRFDDSSDDSPNELYRRSHERHVVQLFHEQEIQATLQKAGFDARSVRHFGQSPILPQRVGFIARKPAD